MDGETSPRRTAAVKAHLQHCGNCGKRLAAIESAAAEGSQAYLQAARRTIDAAGPRALLHARLREIDKHSDPRRKMHLRFAQGLAYVCALALLVVAGAMAWHRMGARGGREYAASLPDPKFTPGSVRQASLSELCASNDEEVVRSVSGSLQDKIFEEYGIKGRPATDFEVDYLITPGLGGSDDPSNLWPEPHSNGVWNSYVKDQLEDHLHRMVCARQVSLNEAQRDIATNWIAAYKKYFHTERPLANATTPRLAQPVEAAMRIETFLPR